MSALSQVKTFFHKDTFSLTHVLSDGPGTQAAIIDSVLDYDPVTGKVSTEAADEVVVFLKENDLKPKFILDTHVHADHLTAARYLKNRLGAEYLMGAHVPVVQDEWAGRYNMDAGAVRANDGLTHMLEEGDTLDLNGRPIGVLETPGHTPACVTYTYDDKAYVGDTFFMPDYGTARCDFPGGDGALLYGSLQKILSLPDDTSLYMCHDYMPGGRELKWVTTVAEQKTQNIHLQENKDAAAFARFRSARDKDLATPRLLLPSLQVNIQGGALPDKESNGARYIKLPVSGDVDDWS